jgi:hypothetical protein
VSFTDPPALPHDDPIRRPEGVASREGAHAPLTANVDADEELRARVTGRQIQETVHTGTFVLLGAGLLLAIAVASMLVVAW